ncbi:unnamed protein product [Eretmochelys imbricata]
MQSLVSRTKHHEKCSFSGGSCVEDDERNRSEHAESSGNIYNPGRWPALTENICILKSNTRMNATTNHDRLYGNASNYHTVTYIPQQLPAQHFRNEGEESLLLLLLAASQKSGLRGNFTSLISQI